ncbi:hypothetical protein MPTK1_8g04630 [Marchantia polymorpha subsp. ruderalis]|uniref:F-box domain-containing protein n=1 Tax=Marchantia polymorpha TaxID=3197 RepID=A0A2R6W1J2_MARPO|nr:hypothetical protein MARPO_0186s0014 [Marchantia polymorpha]BBN18692.1 hypothetical protein Mp_8g04630 [Marchantia polymorpha subsp. ruderalis]|eukprot:PTQ27715.1 hypothetical protein MARPO_0186s0014 [Marchantia polymorpha]
MALQRSHDSMDEKLWSRLPEDLMQRVLVFLPIPDVLRLRCVCKAWNSQLSYRRSLDCPISAAVSQALLSQQPYLLCLTAVASHPTIHVYNVSLRKWDVISLSFLPELDEISIIKSGGGLLYLKARVGHCDDTIFLTCNPLTKTWKQLPSVFSENEPYRSGMSSLTSMVCSSEPGRGYRIIEAGLNGLTDLRTKIYDSATGEWKTSGGLPSQVTGFESEGVIINDCLYGVTCLPYKIIKMELDGGSWSEFSPSLPKCAVYPHLVESLGEMVMLGGYDSCWEEGFIPEPTALKVWRLDRSKMEWECVSSLPDEMLEQHLTKNCFDSLKCAAQGASIFISNFDGSVVLVFDLVLNSWTRLLECPSLSNRQSCIEHMFVFNPSLQITL